MFANNAIDIKTDANIAAEFQQHFDVCSLPYFYKDLEFKSELNAHKNRYVDNYPNKSSRILLQNRNCLDSYINANAVRLLGQDFICTQFPLASTIEDFWLMVYQRCNTNIIVALLSDKDVNSKTDTLYWPNEARQSVYFGKVKLTCRQKLFHAHCLCWLRVIDVYYGFSNVPKTVYHFLYQHWPDMSTPTTVSNTKNEVPSNSSAKFESMYTFHSAIESVYKENLHNSNTIVVHCSAGLGRSPTFIAIFAILNYINNNIQMLVDFIDGKNKRIIEDINIVEIVKSIKLQRNALCIPQLCQYDYIYKIFYDKLIREIIKIEEILCKNKSDAKKNSYLPDVLKHNKDVPTHNQNAYLSNIVCNNGNDNNINENRNVSAYIK